MIAEYCKNGELVCFYDSDDKRWHITRASVENKITKIKALNARKAPTAAPTSASEHSSEDHDVPQQEADARHERSEASHASSDDMKELERELMDLKIANRGKDYFIEQLQKERIEFMTRIEDNSRLVGELKTKLLQLEAPCPDTRRESSRESNGYHSTPLSDSATVDNHHEQATPRPFAEEQRSSFST